MDSDVLTLNDVDLEEGEISDLSDEVYTPLQRPSTLQASTGASTPTPATNFGGPSSAGIKMDDDCLEDGETNAKAIEVDDCQSEISSVSSTSGDSSDTCLNKSSADKKTRHKKRIKRTVMVRVHPSEEGAEQKRTRFKKYDIWTAALQEDTLAENMRGCDVAQNGFHDRNVENYDYSLHYRLNGANNGLKRRLSNSTDDLSDSDQYQHQSKRQRPSSRSEKKYSAKPSVHDRLGKRRDNRGRRYSSTNSGSDSNSYEPLHIEDLQEIGERNMADIGKEMASKLREEKDDLLVRVLEVLGTEIPLKIYKETQRIEAEGGMTIKNRHRRRTPGGVFLFLLKHNDSLSAEDQKAIFCEDRQTANKKQKDIKTLMRDRKVEELKKRLCEKGAELSSLKTRKEHMLLDGAELRQEQQKGNLSNPPPSPEAAEQSPDYKSLAINHVANEDTELSDKPSTSKAALPKELTYTYEDDFLDVNCGDMDFF